MHRIAHLIVTLLLSTLAACSDPPPAVAEVAVLPDYSNIVCKPSVHPFWTKFRDAVLKEDWEAVADMTEFPLPVIQPSPAAKKLLSRKDFSKQFPQFLNAALSEYYHGIKPKPASMRELISATPTLDKKACGNFEGLLSIGRWEFFLRPEGWRLGVVYVREFPASMNHLPVQPLQIIKD